MLFFVTPPPRSSPRKERAGFWPEKKPKGILLAGRRTRGDKGGERGRSAWKLGKNPANDPLKQTKAFGGGSSTDGSFRRPNGAKRPGPSVWTPHSLGGEDLGFLNTVFIFCFFLPVPSAARLEPEAMEGFGGRLCPSRLRFCFSSTRFSSSLGWGRCSAAFQACCFFSCRRTVQKNPPRTFCLNPT